MNKDLLPLSIAVNIPKESESPLLELCRTALSPLLLLLDQRRLSTKERRTMGGVLFRGNMDFVSLVRAALEAEPDLFAHLPIVASTLKNEQDQALELLMVSQMLQELNRQVQDAYLEVQSSVVHKALEIVDRQLLDEQRPFLNEKQIANNTCRSLQLSPARKLLFSRKGMGRLPRLGRGTRNG